MKKTLLFITKHLLTLVFCTLLGATFVVTLPVDTVSRGFALPTNTPKSPQPTLLLSEVMKKKKLGFEAMNFSQEKVAELLKQGKTFSDARKNRKKNEDRWIALVNECKEHPERNMFCPYSQENWKEDLFGYGRRGPKRVRPRTPSVKELAKAVAKADYEAFEHATRSRSFGVFKTYPNWEPLEDLAQAVISEASCSDLNPAMGVALAFKAEEFFPDQKYRDTAIQIYEKVVTCSDARTELGSLARYRVSLLHVWAGQCFHVEPHLKELSEDREGLFTSRAIYWRAYCSRQVGNHLHYNVMRNKLLKQNPLGYHSLSLYGGGPPSVMGLIEDNNPKAVLRTGVGPRREQVNRLLTALEVAIKLEDMALAKDFFKVLDAQIRRREPRFRMYVAALAKRLDLAIPPLRILSSAMREQPDLISDSLLRVFYPMKRKKTIWSHHRKVDPFLVTSLIRQESGFNRYARSRVGAVGLMQLMPKTARRMQRVSIRQLYGPKTNIKLGVRYFRGLLDRFGGDVELSLAAYNAGPERVDDWVKRYPVDNRILFLDLIPFSETRNYVMLIGRNYYWYMNLYGDHAQGQSRFSRVGNIGRYLAARHWNVVSEKTGPAGPVGPDSASFSYTLPLNSPY